MKINFLKETKPVGVGKTCQLFGAVDTYFYCDFSELLIIYTHPKISILLFHKQHLRTPRGYARIIDTLISEVF